MRTSSLPAKASSSSACLPVPSPCAVCAPFHLWLPLISTRYFTHQNADGYVVELRTYGGGGNQATTPAGAGAQAEAPATDTAATDPDKPLNESKCAEGSGI